MFIGSGWWLDTLNRSQQKQRKIYVTLSGSEVQYSIRAGHQKKHMKNKSGGATAHGEQFCKSAMKIENQRHIYTEMVTSLEILKADHMCRSQKPHKFGEL